MTIHPLAAVDPSAKLGTDVSIGPFCVVEANAEIGDGCALASHVVIRRETILGENNTVCEGAILGGLAQHINLPEETGKLQIGSGNVIREHVTMHCSLKPDGVTRVGDDGLYMVGSHIAHDCNVGNNIIMANGVMLAGHVTVGDRVVFGGAAAVHQFSRIGRLCMIGGMARVKQDVPPFITLDGGTSMVVGLNRIGLRRSEITRDEVKSLKQAYQVIYRLGLPHEDMIFGTQTNVSNRPSDRACSVFL